MISKRRFFLVALLIVSASTIVFAQTRGAPQKITFARRATVARASGYLRGVRDEKWFVLRVQANQHVRVEIRGHGPTRGVLVFPSGKQDGGPGGIIFDGVVDEHGDYRIRVTESSMANSWRGRFTVTVEVLPPGQSSPPSSELQSYVGKYPSELFRGVPAIKSRLRGLLGTNYGDFFERMQVETPIENSDDMLVMRGCKAHQCTIEEAILAIDSNSGKLYVALKFGSRFRTFTGGAPVPEALRQAMQN